MENFFSKETFEKVKEFCIENKKYIGVGALLLLTVIFFLVFLLGGGKKQDSNTETVAEFEFSSEFSEKENKDVSELINKYYEAYVSDDLDSLDKLVKPMTDNEKSYIGVLSQYFEKFTDVKIHVKEGLASGSYFVSAEKSVKFYEVETTAPALDFFYVETDKKGNLYINNAYSAFNMAHEELEMDEDVLTLIDKYTSSNDFAKLNEDVNKAYDEAVAGDEKLATMLNETLASAIQQWHANDWVEQKAEEPKDEVKEDTESTEKKED